MTADQWLIPPLSDSITPSILARADLLVTKTAFLAGMVAPETAACLSKLLMVSDSQYSKIIDGHHTEPGLLKDALNSANKYSTLRKTPELRRCVVAALVHHYRLLRMRPLLDGNGVVARMIAHQHLAQLRLHPQLWSLSRGLARRHEEYHYVLHTTESTEDVPFAGGVQRSDKALLGFIEFMFDVCHEEVDYMTSALSRHQLRESVTHAYRTNSRLTEAGVSPETMPALLALLIQGSLPSTEFVTFTGLPREAASDQLNRLFNLDLVVSPPSNLQRLEVDLPAWFAQDLLPDFHLA
jgi:Fic family protein